MASLAPPHYPLQASLPGAADPVTWTNNTPLPRRCEHAAVSDEGGVYANLQASSLARGDTVPAGPCVGEYDGRQSKASCMHELAVRNYQPQAHCLSASAVVPAAQNAVHFASDRRGSGATHAVYNAPRDITKLPLPEQPTVSSCIASPARADMMYSPITHHDPSIAKLDEVPDMPAGTISASRQAPLDSSYAWAYADPDFSEYLASSAWTRSKQPCEAPHPPTFWPEYPSSGGRPSTSSSSSSISTPSLSHSPLSTIEEYSFDYEHMTPSSTLSYPDISFLPTACLSSEANSCSHLYNEADGYYLSPHPTSDIIPPNLADWQEKFYTPEVRREMLQPAVAPQPEPSPNKTVELPELHHPRPFRPYVPPWQSATEFPMEEFVSPLKPTSPPQIVVSDGATSSHAPSSSTRSYCGEQEMEAEEGLEDDEYSDDEMDIDEDWEFEDEDLSDDDQTISSTSQPGFEWAPPMCATGLGPHPEPSWTTRTLPPHSLLCQPLKNPPCYANSLPLHIWDPSEHFASFTGF